MGTVYLVEHELLKTQRALKLLLPEWTHHPQVLARFVNEARAAATIKHRNVVAVHDVGTTPAGEPYILYDYVDGDTLASYARTYRGPVSEHVIVRLMGGIAAGLMAAHKQGIVHRDLKPDNILLADVDGDPRRPHILDFGVAKLPGALTTVRTQHGAVIGTPVFSAPEQLLGSSVSAASDIYALGVIAYWLSSGGYFPYQTTQTFEQYVNLSPVDLAIQQRDARVVDLRHRNPALDESWVRAVLLALEVDPRARPATASAYAVALAAAFPGDDQTPAGLETLKQYAPELVEVTNMLETIRSPRRSASLTGRESRSRLADRYKLAFKLGTGGMAEVYAATVTGVEGFERLVAVKRVLGGYSQDPMFAQMFVREARLAARLQHPNIVSVLDFDRDDQQRLFIAMEYVDGPDLSTLLETGVLPYSVSLYLVTEVLRGLGFAHAFRSEAEGIHGVIHKDISPHNVFVSRQAGVKIGDFGIAAAMGASGVARTTTVKGKVRYMSPEQANNEALDGRSDLFAVGVMLWEMLTDKPLFTGSSKEVLAQLFFRPPRAPSTERAGVPPELDAIAMTLLDRDPGRRFPTAAAAIDALVRCADAPRDGRSEVERLLEERFPTEFSTGRTDPSRTRQERGWRGVVRPQHGERGLESTLQGTASESSRKLVAPPPPSTSRARVWPWLLATAALVAIAVGVTVAALGQRPSNLSDTVAARGGAESGSAVDATPSAPADGAGSSADASLTRMPGPVAVPPDRAPPVADAAMPAPDAANPVPDAALPAPDAALPAPGMAGDGAPPPTTDRPPRPVARGELVIAVDPSAQVTIDGRAYGSTPFRRKLPVGRHRVTLVNPVIGKRKTLTVTITAATPTLIEETW